MGQLKQPLSYNLDTQNTELGSRAFRLDFISDIYWIMP